MKESEGLRRPARLSVQFSEFDVAEGNRSR